jgi:hypothetical protein
MRSPELYTILKVPLQVFCKRYEEKKKHKDKDGKEKTKKVKLHKFKQKVDLKEYERDEYSIKQQYNHLFRIILNNKDNEDTKNKIIKDVLFIDCKNHKNYMSELDSILKDGVVVDGTKYIYWGKSASMSRQGILGLVSEEMYDLIEAYAMMEIKFDKTVLSKFEAYKCLLLSSCFCIEEKLPYMIVVPDYENVIESVRIKYVDEEVKEYVDKKTGEAKTFAEKVIKDGVKDINNNVNDGSGLCSIEQAKKWSDYLSLNYTGCCFMLRVPYVKGLVIAVDFKKFYKQRGIQKIKDIWGKEHDIDKIDIILTESQYKGYKYFKQKGDYSDWERYLGLLNKYNYCIGISKINFSHKTEPKMTRCNYQTLQTLDIETQDLIDMSQYTREWIEKILSGDLLYVLKYLGLKEDSQPDNIYMKSILLNPQMVNDIKIKSYLYGLLRKTIDEIKIGKIYIEGAFKFLVPDVVFMMEYIGGLNPIGCLNKGEMFAKQHEGDYVLNRNPHLSKSEHVILNAVNNELTNEWCSNLENICMINSYDITAPRLNGADKDGDLVLVHKNPTYMKGINNYLPITIDIEDKITAKATPYDRKHVIDFVKKSLDSRIGEISNCASSYSNKKPKDEATKKKYEDYTCLLSVINGKEIDYVKTGIRWSVPTNIQKGVKPLPYFLKYKYKNQTKHSYAKSKLNEHCWFIEKWQRRWQNKLKLKNEFVNTSHCIINNDMDFSAERLEIVKNKFISIRKEFKDLKNQEYMARHYDKYSDFFIGLTKAEVEESRCDWKSFYDKSRKELLGCIDGYKLQIAELTNYMAEIIYNNLNGNCYEMLWGICEEGIALNLSHNRINPIRVPSEIENNEDKKKGREYLGRYYEFVDYKGEI